MSNGRSVHSKVGTVGEGVAGRQTGSTTSTKSYRKRREDILGRGIGLVGNLVEQGLVIYSQRNFVWFAGIVEHAVRVDGEVASVPGVGKPDSSDDGRSEESAKEDLQTEQESR